MCYKIKIIIMIKRKKKGILHTYQNDWGQFKRAWLAGSFNESDDLSRLQKQ